jgi:hypothetical protein
MMLVRNPDVRQARAWVIMKFLTLRDHKDCPCLLCHLASSILSGPNWRPC